LSVVRVGVKRIDGTGQTIPDGEPARAAVNLFWVTVDGEEILPDLMTGLQCDVDGSGFMLVKFAVTASDFQTVSYDGPEAPARFRRDAQEVAR